MKLRLKELIAERGYPSHEAFAEAHGLRPATISRLVNGRSNFRLSTLQSVADALGVRVLDLFYDDETDPDAKELYRRIMSLPPDQVQAYLQILPESKAS